MAKEYGFLIGGKWLKTSRKVEIKSPYSGEVIGVVNMPETEEARRAIDSAEETFREFRKSPSHLRSKILREISDGIEDRRDEFESVLVNEGGKPLKTAKIEVDRAISTFSFASEEANRISDGELVPIDVVPGFEDRLGMTRRFPIGIILGISPFNFPLNLVAHKVAPAIASGNVIVLKPSERTPISALLLGEVATEAGLPPGVFNIIPLYGHETEPHIQDDRVEKVSFTGSDKVGWEIMKKVPYKRVTLELGGNAASVVDEDPPDTAFAVSRNCWGAFYQAGQSCISVQRIYVQERVFDEFVHQFVSETESLKLGDPMLEDTDVGPVIDDASADRIMNWIEEARDDGAKVLTGANRDGKMIEPTVLTNVLPTAKLSREEVFGPVVHIERYRDFDEALSWVNNSKYGLQAAIFTKEMNKAFKAYTELRVGGVIINDFPSFRVDNMPYGGVKDSGVGREGLKYAIEDMTELRLMVINLKNLR